MNEYVSDSQGEDEINWGSSYVNQRRLHQQIHAIPNEGEKRARLDQFYRHFDYQRPHPSSSPSPNQPSSTHDELLIPQPTVKPRDDLSATSVPDLGYDFLEQPPPRRRLRKRAFAAIYPYIADQIRYLRLANINDINNLYESGHDVKNVIHSLDRMYQQNKSKFPRDEKYKAKSLYSLLDRQRRYQQQQQEHTSDPEASSQVDGESQPESQQLRTSPRRAPRIVEDDDDKIHDGMFDFEADDSDDADSESEQESESLELRVGGRIVHGRSALRGVLPESAKRQALWKAPKRAAKRKRVDEPTRKGVARRKTGISRRAGNNTELLDSLINDDIDGESEPDELHLQDIDLDQLQQQAQWYDRLEGEYDEIDPNEIYSETYPNDNGLRDTLPYQWSPPTLARFDSYAITEERSNSPPILGPRSPESIPSDDSDIQEFDYIALNDPGTARKRVPPRVAPRVAPSVIPTVTPRTVARVRPSTTRVARGRSTPKRIPIKRGKPTARAQTQRILSQVLGNENNRQLVDTPLEAKGIVKKQPRANRIANIGQAKLPYSVLPHFTTQLEAEATNSFVTRISRPRTIRVPLAPVSPLAEFDVERLASGKLHIEVTSPISFSIRGESFTLSPLRSESSLVYQKAITSLAQVLPTASEDLMAAFLALIKWSVFQRPQFHIDMQLKIRALFTRCQSLHLFPSVMLLALSVDQTGEIDRYASKYWKLFWKHEQPVSGPAVKILVLRNQWWSSISKAILEPDNNIGDILESLEHLVEVQSKVPDWSALYAIFPQLDESGGHEHHRFIDLVLAIHFRYQWPFEEKLVTILYGSITRRKFTNFTDECIDPELIGVVKSRNDFSSVTFFDRFLMLVYLYVGGLSVDMSRQRKARLNAKLYMSSNFNYHESRDQFTMLVNRFNFTLLLHQVLGLSLVTQFDQLVNGVVTNESTIEFTTLSTTIEALKVYCLTNNGQKLPVKAFAAFFSKFERGYLKIPRIRHLWKKFVAVLTIIAGEGEFSSIVSDGLSPTFPSEFLGDLMKFSQIRAPNALVVQRIESILNRKMLDRADATLIEAIAGIWVSSGADNLTKLVYGKFAYIGDEQSRRQYAPLYMAMVMKIASTPALRKSLEEAVLDMVWMQLLSPDPMSPYLAQLLAHLPVMASMGSTKDIITQLLSGFKGTANTTFIVGYLTQVERFWSNHWRWEGAKALVEFSIVELKRLFPDISLPQFDELVTRLHIDANSLQVYDWLRLSLLGKLKSFYDVIADATRRQDNIVALAQTYASLDPVVIMYAMVNYMRSYSTSVEAVLTPLLQGWLRQFWRVPVNQELYSFFHYLPEMAARYPGSTLEATVIRAFDMLLTMVEGYQDDTPAKITRGYLEGGLGEPSVSMEITSVPVIIQGVSPVLEQVSPLEIESMKHQLLVRVNGVRETKIMSYELAF